MSKVTNRLKTELSQARFLEILFQDDPRFSIFHFEKDRPASPDLDQALTDRPFLQTALTSINFSRVELIELLQWLAGEESAKVINWAGYENDRDLAVRILKRLINKKTRRAVEECLRQDERFFQAICYILGYEVYS